jgi:tetratricopeptide (TPR) repeat protein
MWYRIEAGIAGLLVLLIGTTIAAAGDPAPETPPAGNQADRLKQGAAFWVEAARLRDQGKLPEAIAAIEQVLVIEREHFGKTAPEEIAASLACLASLQDSIEDFAAARKSREEILSIRSRLHGPADWRTIDARLALQHTEWLAKASPQQRKELAESDRLLMQAVRLMKEGKPREAVPLAERSVSIRKQVLGDADLSYAFAAGRFAYISGKAGDYARAEQLFRQVSEILKKVLGENHPDYATNLNNLAVLYENRGDYERAEPLYRQALEIQRKVLGENHPDYAGSLNNLALLYEARGDYPRAEPLLRQALQIRKKVLGENDLDYAVSLNSLGEFYRAQGDYARAEPLLRQALEIKRRVLGENHPQFSASLNNLALLYEAQGDYARALPLLLQALEIDKKVLGENHPDYATSLNSLAGLCQDLGDYARAEMLFRQVLEIEKKTRGENHPYYAAALSNLACLYDDQGDYARAEPLYRQALEIQKKVLGENHPDYARSLNNLAKPYAAQGQYAQAEPLLRQASEIWKRVLGENHPDYAVSLNNLAALYECQGEDARAEPLFRRASAITRNHLDATAAVQSERQQLAMLQKLRWYLDSYLSLMVRTGRYTDPGYREMLAWKGIVLRRQRQLRAVGENPELAPVFAQLQRVAAQLARLAWATPDPKQEAGWHEQVARLSEEKERLEAELSSRSTAYRQAKRQVTLEELQAAIPKDVVLVDIIEFSRSEFVVLPQRGGIGAVLQRNDGGAKIEELVAGGEAAKDGRLQAGDLIVAVAGQDGKWTA